MLKEKNRLIMISSGTTPGESVQYLLRDKNFLRQQYMHVIAYSKPLFLTKMLGSWKYVIIVSILISIYIGCLGTAMINNLFNLKESSSKDYFLQSSIETKKYLTYNTLLQAIDDKIPYIKAYFEDPILEGKSYDQMI